MAKRPTAADVRTEGCCAPLLAAPLDEGEAKDLASAFAALADPVRLRLLSLIAAAGEVCSCDLLEAVGKAQPTVSLSGFTQCVSMTKVTRAASRLKMPASSRRAVAPMVLPKSGSMIPPSSANTAASASPSPASMALA